MKRQRKLFTNFCNAKLCERDDVPPVTNVFEDIRDGRLLYALLEELSGQSLAPLGRIKKSKRPLTRIDHVANLSISFRYIKQTTKVVGIGPGDIADGNESLILGLLWSIIVFFTAKDLGGVDDVSALKKKILKWCQKRTAANDDVDVRNLKDSFMGGRAFLAILHDVDPSFAYAPGNDNFNVAFREAADKYGVPVLLDGDDHDCWRDEQSMVTYLSEMMKRLPEKAADPSVAPMAWVDARKDDIFDDLVALCSVPTLPPTDATCAHLLADIMTRDGLVNVEIVGEQDPFVLASAPFFDPALPTLLFVADYAGDDPVAWTVGDPFSPEIVRGTALVAAGAPFKAGALAPVKAVAALVAALPDHERPPVNIEILLACADPKDYDRDGRVERFVASTYVAGGRPVPSFALIDVPGAARTVAPPGVFAAVFACRGRVQVDVVAAVADAESAVCGPLLDANLVLATTLAALRDQDRALPNVPGLVGFAEPNRFANAVSGALRLEPQHLADGVHYYTNRLATSSSSVVNQLCFQPGVTVAKLQSSASPGESATATVVANLPPAFPHCDALAALRMALDAAKPWDADIFVDDAGGETGFLTDIAPHFLAKVAAAAKRRFDNRAAAIAASPEYLPLAASVARALPRTAAYACGVHDPHARIGQPGEAVDLTNFTSTIKTFIQLVLDLKALPNSTVYGAVDAASVFPTTKAGNA